MRVRVFFLFLVFTSVIFAQTPSEADALFGQRKYDEASRIYAILLEKRSVDPLYNYRYARCLYEMQKYDEAIRHFLAGGSKYPLRDFYLADSYFMTYRFSEAIEYFNTYLNSNGVNQSYTAEVLDKLRRSRLASRLMSRVEDIAVIDSMVVSQQEFLKYYHLSRETGKLQQKSFNVSKKGLIDLVSFVTQRGDRRIHSDTIGSRINLYTSNKLLDGWSKSEPLSESINTVAFDENYPFLRLDGLTLYFASNGENSIGGYDIFITRFAANTNDYLNPENIGMPFNSLDNDYMFVIDETNQTAWFATDRYQKKGKVIIYQIRYQDEKTYIPMDDQNYLIKAAQLKISRKDTLRDEIVMVQVKETNFGERHDMHFELNDDIIYTNTDQFRSEKALKLWNEWHRISVDLTEKEEKLKQMRADYELLSDSEDKKLLTKDIISLEEFILKSKRLLEETNKNIREEEINYINNTH
ncbi:MAG: tetratricopeptide repeat protein [Paludibacter sp.]|nr:tetratricopeptide repeat protein [Paludibacter sp.]